MKKLPLAILLSFLFLSPNRGQGVNIPVPHWGLSFGNSTRFNGLRFNLIDKDIEKINGINVKVWGHKNPERQTGTVNGISIGLPAALGTADLNGINLGVAGVGAKNNIRGINLGILGAGAGNNASGINFGALGTGAGNNLCGLNLGGFGVGAGGNMTGINLGGLGAGAGGNVWGLSFGGLGVGAGGSVTGLNLSLLAVGAGNHLKGISLAGLGVGAPRVTGLQLALVSGGETVRGITLAPAYFRIDGGDNPSMKGISVSAFNHIRGEQFGIAIGIFNYAYSVHGLQLGLLNHVKNNPKALRWLPIFNTSF